MKFNYLTRPIRIGTMELKNRMVQPGMDSNLAAADGTVTDMMVDYYARRANGGVGLLITEVCCPERTGRVVPGELEASDNRFLPGLSRLASAAHSGGARIALQLAHGGCFASQAVTGQPPVSPSGVGALLLPRDKPRVMTAEEIKGLVKAYGTAAKRAKVAGFDAVELHGAHGYLPQQFLSGYTNRRTDEYGGNLPNRARFALEVIRTIKEFTGKDFPLIYRISAEEGVPGGITPAEAARFAQWAEAEGVNAIHVSTGTWDSRMADFQKVMAGEASPEGKRLSEGVSIGMWVPPFYVPRGNLVRLAEGIKKNVAIPVIAVGGISPEMGEDIIASGKADLVALGRQSISDPAYPRKVIRNAPEEIRRCLRCNECLRAVLNFKGLHCAVNPEAGQEHEAFVHLETVVKPKNIMVIGGGPAGMEAARVAALRGHNVTLYEKENQMGGMLRYSSIPDFKKDTRDFMNWQISELKRQKVKVVLGEEVTPGLVQEKKPDAIVVATGARPARPPIEGINGGELYDALDVLAGKIPEGQRITVCGAGLVGAEVGMYLAESYGKKVVLVDTLPGVVTEAETFTRWVAQSRLAEDGIEIRVNHAINRIAPNGINCATKQGEVVIKGDAVVLALGMTPDPVLYHELRKLAVEVIPAGDAVKARKVIDAVHEGYHAGRRV